MRGYLSVVSARFRTLLQYRAAALAGLSTQFFWGLIRVMIFEAFYRASSGPQPISIQEVVGYIWLGQAFLLIQPWGFDREIRDQIRTGSLAYELVRPLDLYGLWLSRAIAQRTAPTLLRSIPLLALAIPFFGLGLPASPAAFAAFLATLAGAVLVSATITVLVNVSLLWTISGEGVTTILPALAYFLSGLIVPLPLFPAWARVVVEALPFRDLADVPFRLYLGHLPASALPGVLLHEAVWIVVLILLGRAFLAAGRRRLVVQGG